MGHRSFEEADLRLLTSLANVAAAKIQNARLMADAAEKKQMDREFALAREIQQRLLPENPPEIAGYELYGSNIPSRQVSGDYFDFRLALRREDLRHDRRRLRQGGRAGAADGLAAGLVPRLGRRAWPCPEMTGRLSEAISRRTGPDRFITFFLLLLDPVTGRDRVHERGAQSGPAAAQERARSRSSRRTGYPLALFPGQAVRLLDASRSSSGEILCLYTDGVTEANDPQGNEFGMPA